jgi:hypothetical protein
MLNKPIGKNDDTSYTQYNYDVKFEYVAIL